MRQRLYRASKRQKCSWNSTERSRLVAVSIYVQSNYSDETVMQYLLKKRGKRSVGYDEKAEDDCRFSPIRDWFLNVPFNVLEEIALHPLSKIFFAYFKKPSASSQRCKLVCGWRKRTWRRDELYRLCSWCNITLTN